MKNKITLFLFGLLISLTVAGQTYITDVAVIDVVTKELKPRQTVVIDKTTISAIAPSGQLKVPAGAKIIDGARKFLIPGLTDAHVHFFQSGGLYTRPDVLDLRKYRSYEDEINWTQKNMDDPLKRYLSAGITTAVDVGSTYNFLKLRDSLAKEDYAPTIYMSGPLLTPSEPEPFKNLGTNSPFVLFSKVEQVRQMVRDQLPARPDFIKIWYVVDTKDAAASARKYLPMVKAIIDEAHKHKLKVAVHATEQITAKLAVESGCDFLVHSVEDELISDSFARLLKTKNTILCPTMTVDNGYTRTFGQSNRFSYYELTRSNPEQIGSLEDLKHLPEPKISQIKEIVNSEGFIAQEARTDSIRSRNLRKLTEHGVLIAAGTDAGNIGTHHATSYLAELKEMQQAGLNTWQILQSATINPAKIFNKESSTGSITTGKIADLVLLNANPLEKLENITDIKLVFNKGKAFSPDTLIAETPLALVQRQLNAYNARNIEAFLEPYADDVELYSYPDTLLSKGKESMLKNYSTMFEKLPNLHCEITERTVQGNIVTDKERVTGMGKTALEATAIYHIKDNKISKVYFIQ